jgi:hypothetical protein
MNFHRILLLLLSIPLFSLAEVRNVNTPEKIWYDDVIFADFLSSNEKQMEVWILSASGRIPKYSFKKLAGDQKDKLVKMLEGAVFKEKGSDRLLIDFDDEYYREKNDTYGFIIIRLNNGQLLGFNRFLGMCNNNALEPIYVKEFDDKNEKLLWGSRMDLLGLMLKGQSEKLFTSK